MNTATSALRAAAAVVLLALSSCATPVARAITPPPIDNSRLPEPAPPAPPRSTVQREMCAVPSMDAPAGEAVGQLAGLGIPQAWQLSRGSGQRVAVIDTGVSPHPRLPETAPGGDYVFTGDGLQDCDGHGTAVAGIIAAASDPEHPDDFSGVAPEVALISIRQSSSKFGAVGDPSNTGSGDVDTMAKAVRTAADLGASVINISSVACVPASSALDDRALGAALAYAVDVKNAVVVAAAGNTGGPGQCPAPRSESTWETASVVVSPAWYDDYVLTVGSVNAHGEPSSFTLAGPWVDVAAPGESVTSLSPSGTGIMNSLANHDDPTPLSGTSYAAPVVSGLAALIRSRFPTLTARQVMQRIESTAHHPPGGWNPLTGNGLIDIGAAVSTDAPAYPDPRPREVAIPSPAPPPAPDRHSRDTAYAGTAVCLAVLAAALSIGALSARLRRARGTAADGVSGD